MNKILEQQTNLIDGERKFVGQLDIKVFHATHQKKDWDKFHAKTVLEWDNVPEMDEDDSAYILAASTDSDNSFMDDNDDWSYYENETVPPHPCHHCQYRGRHRIKPVDYSRIKNKNFKRRQQFTDVLKEKLPENKISRKTQNNKTKFQASQDDSYLNTKTFAKHQEKIAVLTSAMQKFFAEQLVHESEIEHLQKQLDILAVNEDFSDTYQMLSRKLNNLISEGAWREKGLFQTKKELEKLRKRQGYSKIARALMAIGKDPTLANITYSIIHSNS